jgi:hypothetical protein
MRRLLKRSAAALGLAITLSACAMLIPPDNRLMFGMLPVNELGYSVNSSGEITIEARQFQFTNPAGMPVAVITGYRAEFRDQLGTLIGRTSLEPQAISITVPAGYQCTDPDQGLGCNPMSIGARPAPGIPATGPAISSQLLNADIAEQHLTLGTPTGWYADITFYGYNAYGEFEETYRVNIVAPN